MKANRKYKSEAFEAIHSSASALLDKSTIQKWEIGAKRPSGMALKLLSVIQKHGLHILD